MACQRERGELGELAAPVLTERRGGERQLGRQVVGEPATPPPGCLLHCLEKTGGGGC
ncbi:hypothetical protein [Pseudohaliea sp.]|uniref:hypothetical protein n=1 Tax=Pseudohaliea sp. TaxID=2740289 RepID=UPI0032EC204B